MHCTRTDGSSEASRSESENILDLVLKRIPCKVSLMNWLAQEYNKKVPVSSCIRIIPVE